MISKNFKLFSLLIFIFLISFNGYAAQNKPKKDKEDMAIKYLISTLESMKFYSQRYPKFPRCVLFITDKISNKYVDIELREDHDNKDCPGDPDVAPKLDAFRVYTTKPMKIDLYDINGSLKSLNK